MPTLFGRKIKLTYYNLLQVSQAGNTGLDGTVRDIEDGKGMVSPIAMSNGSPGTFRVTGFTDFNDKIMSTILLDNATGDETVFYLSYTVNKLTSGDDTGILLVRTNTNSPGTSYFLKIAGYGLAYPYLNIQEYGSGYAISYEGAGGGNYTRFEFSNLDMVGINSANGCIVHTAGGFYDGNRAIFGANWNGVQLGDIYQISWANGHGVDATRYGPWDTGLVRSSAGVVKVTGGGSNLGSLQVGNTAVVGLVTPAAPVITQGGTPGATTYGYKVVAKLRDGSVTLPSAEGTTATGNAVLDGTNYNIITWVAVAGAVNYDVYRSTGGATQGLIISGGSSPQNDTGFAAAGAEPTVNTTGRLTIGDSSAIYHDIGIYEGGGTQTFQSMYGYGGKAGGTNYLKTIMYAGTYVIQGARGDSFETLMMMNNPAYPFGQQWRMNSHYTYEKAAGTDDYGFYSFNAGFGELQANSDYQTFFAIRALWNQSGTAGGDDLLIKRVHTGTGSGARKFIRMALGAVTYISAIVDHGYNNGPELRVGGHGGGTTFFGFGNDGYGTGAITYAVSHEATSAPLLTFGVSPAAWLSVPYMGVQNIALDAPAVPAGGGLANMMGDTVTLADNVVTDVLDIDLANTKMLGGTIHYTIKCVDATPNYQIEQGTLEILAFNKAGTITASIISSSTQLLGSGTLTSAWTLVDATNKVTLKVNANSSLTPTSLVVTYQLHLNHDGAVTRKA